MQHFSHKHPLILNEIYHAKEGDKCNGCNEQIVSCRSFVYSCINATTTASTTSDVDDKCRKFLLHKTCASLPLSIEHPMRQKVFLSLKASPRVIINPICDICHIGWRRFIYENLQYNFVCVKCAMLQLQSSGDSKLEHAAHRQHPLTLVPHLASFKCYACKVEDNVKDLSYMCTKCVFWMHKNCADAPTSVQFQFHHQHPLTLSFSLPQVYRKFNQYCKLCKRELSWLDWIYYCPKCRFFSHFHCARSNPMFSFSDDEMDDSDLVHLLPAADESALNLLFEEFVKALSSQNHNDDANSIINGATKGTSIKHWTHDEHDLQVMSINDDNNGTLLLCDGCVKPIRIDGGLLYGCATCKYFLHEVCAELPRDIKHHLWPADSTLSANKYKESYKYFSCCGCLQRRNGISFAAVDDLELDIGCVSLPKLIKHKAHRHQLKQVLGTHSCEACGWRTSVHTQQYQCKRCDFCICARCIMKPEMFKHPWDRHPLQLIYDPAMVLDHEDEYNCEFCSEVIDPNKWFYHCTHCDLSFHLEYTCFETSCCLDRSGNKFGATNIKIDKLHPHSLTYVLCKRVRSCQTCSQPQLGQDVLECASCEAVFCSQCCRNCDK